LAGGMLLEVETFYEPPNQTTSHWQSRKAAIFENWEKIFPKEFMKYLKLNKKLPFFDMQTFSSVDYTFLKQIEHNHVSGF
jgi:hypothetical protein